MINTVQLSKNIRAHSLQMVHRAKASHIASALSIVDILAVLYGQVMKYDPKEPNLKQRDRFILSKGHACVAVYATLAEMGFFSAAELLTYGVDHSNLMNHISHKIPGVEFSTGSLGHGLPFGVGKALAAKSMGEKWKTFVVMSDGEMDEGSNWEALMFATHHRLGNLIAIIDYNKLQSLDSIENTLGLEPLKDKLLAFGAEVLDLNGHDHSQLREAFNYPHPTKPLVIIANTIKGKGISFMENKVEWHYKNPNDQQLAAALQELI
jgi:transketolase